MRPLLLGLYRIRGLVYYAAAAILIANVVFGPMLQDETSRGVRRVLGVGALIVFALCIVLVLAGHRLLRTGETKTVVSPVRGRWRGMNSPASKTPSHGVRMYGQAYAVDLVHEPDDSARPAFGDGSGMRRPADYPAFGRPVLAMVDGVVVTASGRRRDHRARSSTLAVLYMTVEGMIREIGGPGFILGNHVTVRGDDGAFATVAHLQRGSLSVRVGDRVTAGDPIARCGNSGNSSEPHVHAQLMDRRSPWTARGLPLVFAGIALDGDPARVDAMPADDQVMIAG